MKKLRKFKSYKLAKRVGAFQRTSSLRHCLWKGCGLGKRDVFKNVGPVTAADTR